MTTPNFDINSFGADSEKLTQADIDNLVTLGVNLPLNINALREYLPHRYPFLLLDRVTACQPNEWITAIKNVSVNEPFFTGHFPQEPIMPGVLMVEAMAQVAGVLGFISENKKPADGYLYLFAGVDNVRFKRQVIPGDTLILRAKLLFAKRGIYKFECTASVGDELAVSAEVLLSQQKDRW